MSEVALFDPVALELRRLAEGITGRLGRITRLTAIEPRWDELDVHRHAVPTLVLCLAGVVRIGTGPARYLDLNVGDGVVVGVGVWHVHHRLRGGCAVLYQGLLPRASDVGLFASDRHVTSLIARQPAAELLAGALAGRLDAVEAVEQLLRDFLSSRAIPFRPDPALGAMLDCLYANLHLGISAETLLRASGLSRSRAHQVFLDYAGEPPKRFMLHLRLDLAAHLLGAGWGVAEAAGACGFPRRCDFTRLFSARFGLPPSRVRDGATPVPLATREPVEGRPRNEA